MALVSLALTNFCQLSNYSMQFGGVKRSPQKYLAASPPGQSGGSALQGFLRMSILVSLMPLRTADSVSLILLTIVGEGGMLWAAREHRVCPGPSLPARSMWSSAKGGGAQGQPTWVSGRGDDAWEKLLALWGRSGWVGLELGSAEREKEQSELGPKRSELCIPWISLVRLPGALK